MSNILQFHKGADKLMNYISKHISGNNYVVGMEATGHYWYTIYSYLVLRGINVYVINPIQSDSFRHLYIRQTKNDSKDSFFIAEVIRFGQFTTTSLADDDLLALRQLCRYRANVISSRTEIKLRINTILEQIYPEYEKIFNDKYGSSSLAILKKISPAREYCQGFNR
ncbi:MAG: IS110 family transposase [Butyrivibrio sp.]|nr:IS110 family transposase [Butyrivibrio sp.]